MAKAYITQSKRIGSVGGETYSVVKGQTIVRGKPVSVANPRTDAQMTQRTQFLSAVRFYQRATQRFFKFAFEGKKSVESDYNAFMRLNAKVGGYLTKAQSDAAGFPMIAPFTLSQGSIVAPTYGLDAILHGSNSAAQLVLGAVPEEEAPLLETVAEVSENILATYPSYRAGDIVTIVSLYSSATGEFWDDLDAAAFSQSGDEVRWDINQIIIDTTNDASLESAGLICSIADGKFILEKVIAPRGAICGCAVVISRNDPSGLKVSNAQVSLSPAALNAYDAMRDAAHLQQVLAWWGSQQQAILQGSVATPAEPTRKARINSVDGDFNLPHAITMIAGDQTGFTIGFNSAPVGVTTADFRVEGFRPTAYTLDFVADNAYLEITAGETAQGSVSVYYRSQRIISITIGG